MLIEVVKQGSFYVRDLVGGIIEFFFVFFIKFFYILFIMGIFYNEDLKYILQLIEFSVFKEVVFLEEESEAFEKEFCVEDLKLEGVGDEEVKGGERFKEGFF